MRRLIGIVAAAVLGAAVLATAVACGRRGGPPGGAASNAATPQTTEGATPAAGTTPATPGAGAAPATGTAPATPAATAPGSAPPEPARRDVVLFFEQADDDALAPERRSILETGSVTDLAKQIVTELAAGPRKEGRLPTVPAGTKVLGLYLDRTGTAYVNLSEEFVSLHPGGSSDEMATIFSIVDSLTYNLKEVRRVRFLVGGEERDTLKSHLDLRRAYLSDMSIVHMGGANDGAGGGTR